jgi:hypothetical protein
LELAVEEWLTCNPCFSFSSQAFLRYEQFSSQLFSISSALNSEIFELQNFNWMNMNQLFYNKNEKMSSQNEKKTKRVQKKMNHFLSPKMN